MTTFEGPPLASVEGIGALTLGGFMTEVGHRYAEREALVFDDPLRDGETQRWSYADLEHEAVAVAAGLVARGVGHSTRVGILMGNRPEAVAAIFGTGLAGGVAVPISTFSTPTELRHLLARSEVVGVLTQRRLLTADLGSQIAALVDDHELAYLQWSASVGEHSWDSMIDDGEAHLGAVKARAAGIGPGDPGLILFSSGTTSTPKAMLHSHRAPTLQFWLQADTFRRTTRSRVWAPLPLFWTAGLTTALGPTLAGGGCLVLQEVFEAGAALGLLARERVTEPYTLPHQAAALAEHPDWETTDLSALREVYGKSVFTRHPTVQGDTTWTLPNSYGMSETCAIVVSHRWDASRAEMTASTGRPMPGVRLRVVDPDTGEILGPNQHGELALAGPTLMDRYLGMTREECFDVDGFFHTGDVGFVDSAGDAHWTGRSTEMIKTAGANVSPAELEVALRAFPAVRRSRVVGVPDALLGEAVTLCVELTEGAEASVADLTSFLGERVARYKVPRHVLFFAHGELPTTGSDTKVRDDELIAIATQRLATQPPPRSSEPTQSKDRT